MKAFFGGLFGSLLITAIVLGGLMVYRSLGGDVSLPSFLRPDRLVIERPSPVEAQRVITEDTGAVPDDEAGNSWLAVELTKEKVLSGPVSRKSEQGFTGDTGGVWYQIGGFTLEEIAVKDHITTPGLDKKPHTRYLVVSANYSAENYSDAERYFFIEDSYIADMEGRRNDSALSADERKGSLYRQGERKEGKLKYYIPIYDLPAQQDIYLFIDRVLEDPIEGEINHRISFR